jgi:bifunctional DNA-binding transcriptional regulator/antitoxin component of YhaV-PrlF toxin-antitoxin module
MPFCFVLKDEAALREILDSFSLVRNLYFMSELTTVTVSRKGQAMLPLKWRKTFGLESGGPCDARELNDGKGSLLLVPRPKKRRGTKGLLAHLRQQTVSFPPIQRHNLPSK